MNNDAIRDLARRVDRNPHALTEDELRLVIDHGRDAGVHLHQHAAARAENNRRNPLEADQDEADPFSATEAA